MRGGGGGVEERGERGVTRTGKGGVAGCRAAQLSTGRGRG